MQQNRIGAWFDNKKSELLLIQREAGANTITVVDSIKAMMPHLQESIPPTVKVDLVSDRSLTIRASVDDVQWTLLITIALVVMVIFIFLRHVWATIIPSATVPLSLVGTFARHVSARLQPRQSVADGPHHRRRLRGRRRHRDDREHRALSRGGDAALEAAIKGAGQIGFTIISITFSLIAVFIPLLFMGGIVGRLFHEFAVTVTIAVLVSAFVSLTLTPVMCSLFLQRESEQKANWLSRGAEHVFEAILAGYDRSLRWVLSHQPLMLLVTLGLIALTGYLYVIIPKGFFPQQDTGFIFAQAEAREDISFAAMSAIQHRLASIVERDPAVEAVVAFAGATGGNATENTARMFMQLKPFGERNVSADQVIQRLRAKTAVVPGVRFYMQAGQDINVGGRLARTQYQYTLTDTNTEELNHWAPIIEHAMAKLPELQDVASDQQVAAPHLSVDIDRDMAYRMGLSLSLIDQTLYDAFGQRQIATIYSSTNQYKVILEVAPGLPGRSRRARRAVHPRAYRRAGAAQRRGAFHPEGRAALGQSRGPVPRGHALLQPDARRGAGPGRREDPGAGDHAEDAAHPRRRLPGHGPGLPILAELHALPGRGRHLRGLCRAGHAL